MIEFARINDLSHCETNENHHYHRLIWLRFKCIVTKFLFPIVCDQDFNQKMNQYHQENHIFRD